MLPIRVKICGITRAEDAITAIMAGASAIGFIFWPQSVRFISPEQTGKILASVPPFVTSVGVYVDPTAKWVNETSKTAGLSLLQFHGNETPDFCNQFHLPYIKALRVRKNVDLVEYAKKYHHAKGLLLDSYTTGMPGGTGQQFDWKLIPPSLSLPLILSGGLNPNNVEQAILQTCPWAVDVSSGVESAKGIKDKNKITAFMLGVRKSGSL